MEDQRNKWLKSIHYLFNPVSIRSNQRLVIFLVCLFIATILWFLNALSKNYTTILSYPVKYVNLPKNKFIINNPPSNLQLRVNAYGFTLLRYKISFANSPVLLNISEIMDENRIVPGGVLNLQTSIITENIRNQFSSDIQVIDVRPSIVQLVFDSLESRRLPVASRLELHYSTRFGQSGNITINPPTVEVTGARALIENLDTIYTERKIYRNVKASLEREVTLEMPDKMTLEPKKVTIRIPVDEFTEKSMIVPLSIRSKPDEVNIRLFPREVEVSFSVPLKRFAEITPETLELYINWEDVEKGLTHLPVYSNAVAEGIKSLKINPTHIEYLIEKK